MKKWIIAILLIAMMAYAVIDFLIGNQESENEEVGLDIGNVAPDFELQTLTGDTVLLSDFRGQPVMLNFWATWCPPCRAEMPDMQQFHENTDITILAINLTTTEATEKDVPDFVEEFGLEFAIPMDRENKVADLYQIRPIPTSYLIDRDGVIQFYTFGPLNYEQMMLEYNKLQ
ncbi:peroxiredoxin family protein [Gracilibacillus kekensis]|uniref:Peroxiredoxin n=1 Tax=Gracilibacillus kekensis TaxID=1027249 RepID=A0A1M7KKF7_9BACI|nr:TlpA disulfide reductase family protein [Gracilibacillus kekensis]SHM65824.1 Peroxiredoxin [Gracilibacillus kekensis]